MLRKSLRHLLKNKVFTALNLIGLSAAFFTFFVTASYVFYELSYDTMGPDMRNLFRVTTANITDGDLQYHDAMSFNYTGELIESNLTTVERYTKAVGPSNKLDFRFQDHKLTSDKAFFVDSEFLRLFNYPVASGSHMNLLSDPGKVVITRVLADKLMGIQDPLGKSFQVLTGMFKGTYLVEAVIEDVPQNTHLKFEILFSYERFKPTRAYPEWGNFDHYTYIQIGEGADLKKLENDINNLKEELTPVEENLVHRLQRVGDIHLKSHLAYEAETNGDYLTVLVIFFVSTSLLLMSWVNYANVSISSALTRAKEAGIHKILGASRKGLFSKYVGESMILFSIGWLLALMLYGLLRHEIELSLNVNLAGLSIEVILNFLLALIIGVVLASFYPAALLSNTKVVQILKGKFNPIKRHRVGRALTIFQVTTAFIVITGTFIVDRQVRYMINKDLGADLRGVMVVNYPGDPFSADSLTIAKFNLFKNNLANLPLVNAVATSHSYPGSDLDNIISYTPGLWWNQRVTEDIKTYYLDRIDEHYLNTYNIQLLSGVNFKKGNADGEVLINKTALSMLGFDAVDQAAGSSIQIGGNRGTWKVIGVIKDFNRLNAKVAVEPTLYLYMDNTKRGASFISIQVPIDNLKAAVNQIEDSWYSIYPDHIMNYTFADQRFMKGYEADQTQLKILGLTSFLTMMIASIGIYGLMAFLTFQRIKEIGIRKTLGASSWQISKLLIAKFITLILIAIGIGIPVTYVLSTNWLSNFAYQIELSAAPLISASVTVVILMSLSIIYRVLKASKTNPAEVLKTTD